MMEPEFREDRWSSRRKSRRAPSRRE
jgi:hypothetical protein